MKNENIFTARQFTKLVSSIFILLFFSFQVSGQTPKIKLGIEVLKDNNFEILKNKRVGLVTNASGVDSKLKLTIDILYESDEVNLVALYGPEHGIRGDVEGGDKIDNYVDPVTNIPVYSLYGKNRKPNKEMLENIDVLVYDIQDIGCRSYTFISTMGKVMEAAAEFDKEVLILDRPNPLGGIRIEGNYVEEGYYSFISQFKIPYVYGLTCGELALMLNEEGMLEDGVKCKLKVVPMEGWKRNYTFDDTGLLWVPTSPHIPHKDSPFFYVVSGIVGELRDVISIGVGYTLPFQTFATYDINGYKIAEELNRLNLEGIIFKPILYRPYYAFGKGDQISGVQVFLTDYSKAPLMKTQFYFLEAMHKVYPDKNIFEETKSGHLRAFDRGIGTDNIRALFSENFKVSDIEKYLDKDIDDFRKLSKKYYLYE